MLLAQKAIQHLDHSIIALKSYTLSDPNCWVYKSDEPFTPDQQILYGLIDNIIQEQVRLATEKIISKELDIAKLDVDKFQKAINLELDSFVESKIPNVEALNEKLYKIGKDQGYDYANAKTFIQKIDTNALYTLNKNNLSLIKDINKSLEVDIRKTVSSAIVNKVSNAELARRIERLPLNPIKTSTGRVFSVKERAEMIAKTETQRALNTGLMDSYKELGIKWFDTLLGPRPCNTCIGIRNDGPYRVGIDPFPPFHPRCFCVPVPSTYKFYNSQSELNNLENNYPINPNINQTTRSNIANYTDDSSSINYALEKGKISDNKYIKRDYNIGQNINNAITKNGHNLIEDSILWRVQDNLYIKNPKIGGEYSFDRLLSTTFSKEVANTEFTREGWLLRIQAPKNTKGLYVEDLTRNFGEYEYILPSKTKFKILELDNKNKYIKIQIL